jgi:hypothetical protein
MMNCRKASRLHTASREGALTGSERFFYDLHMRICPGCNHFKDQLDTTVQVLGGLGADEEAPTDDLLEALAKELPKKE